VGGAIRLDDLIMIIKNAGFKDLIPLIDDVTDEYALKWGYGLDIKNYIQRGLFIGKKLI